LIGATVAAFVAGGVSVWALFGAKWSYSLNFGTGTRADWVAAFGTWVIGVAATAVATITFFHTRRHGLGTRAALLSSTRFITADALWLEVEVRSFLDGSEQQQTWRQLRKMVDECHIRSETIKIDSSALPHIPHEASRKLVSINNRLRGFRSLMASDSLKMPAGKDSEFVGHQLLDQLREVHEFSKELDEHCNDFSRILIQAAKSGA
jgi:hypothetical protein